MVSDGCPRRSRKSFSIQADCGIFCVRGIPAGIACGTGLYGKLVVEGEGEYYGIKEMRKHGAWYIKGMKGAASARDRIVRAATLDEFCDIMKHIAE